MSELAFNMAGNRFRPDSNATYWLTRRIRDRGLEVVYKQNGCSPLSVPVEATEEEFRREVAFVPGKYRLDQLDGDFQPIEGATPAYVYVHAAKSAAAEASAPELPPAEGSRAARGPEMSETALLLREVVHVNAEMTKAVTERLATIIEATATLVRAADGAGMPARQPIDSFRNAAPVEEDDTDGDDDATPVPPNADMPPWMRFGMECVPVVNQIVGLGSAWVRGKTGAATTIANVPRNAAPAVSCDETMHDALPTAQNEPAATATVSATPRKATTDSRPAPEIPPEVRAHFIRIYASLSPEEAAFAKAVAEELTADELAHWMRQLAAMNVDDAVATIRAECAQHATRGDDIAASTESVS